MARVINLSRDVVLGQRVEVAETFARRLVGLIGRRGWGDRDGLWLEPCAGVHALGMRFPVDVVVLDDGLRALWVGTVRPWRLGRVHLEARAALELPAGTLEETETGRGDRLRLERVAGDDGVLTTTEGH